MRRREWLRSVASAAVLLAATGCANGSKKSGADVASDAAEGSGTSGDVRAALPDGVVSRRFGSAKVTWIRDNEEGQMRANQMFVGADSTRIAQWAPEGGVPTAIAAYLVEVDGKRILIDTANGKPDSRLLPGLAALGIQPEAIDYIYITHFHGDHLGGMMKEGAPVFANAQVYVSAPEYDAWMTSPALAGRRSQAEATMRAYEARLRKFAFGDTLPGGILAMDAVGHTPGHAAFVVDKCLIGGDFVHGAALQLAHPELCARFDMDVPKSVETRKRLMAYAKENGMTLAGMHLPAPGFIERW